ncbi:probable ATP-dependent RNA helicase DDX5 [Rhipicephalus sanguineus]|uniref:probable ATP-dependent RNA helicase DDX5 n=1 Tax=Rhipicephalus sanguineus TaxID=34632 RepID=UPI0018950C3F|nr:probable ATP-dependent RNA helicase DDX5 [Rhipicephalus sanguineus]
MGFEKTLRSIAALVRPDRQTLIFANSGSREIENLADCLINDYVQVSIGRCKLVEDKLVEQIVIIFEKAHKLERLVALLQDILREKEDKVIVFVETRLMVDEMVLELRHGDWSVVGIHGAKARDERQKALDAFKSGSSSILVLTDVAAQRLDVDRVRFVVHYDRPANADVYVNRPFEKNLYEEHQATASRSMADVEGYRKANGVSVKGRDVPKPILALEESNFPDFIVKVIEAGNFLGIAETGSHKTLAYLLPAVIHIHTLASELGKRTAVRSVCAANGERKKSKYAELHGGCHTFVATPRCLIEFLEEGQVNLHRCTYLVFDEVDRMLTVGYQRHVLKIVELCQPDHQTIMWAISWQKNLKPLIEDVLDDYVEISFGTAPRPVENTVEMTVDWKVEEITLKLRKRGRPAMSLHCKKEKKERDWILSMFNSCGESVLVTTDMAVQDLVLPDVRLVVNYDCPDCSKVYVHRSRHAQRSDEPSMVHTFLVPSQHFQARTLVEILRDARQPGSHELYELAKNVHSKR